MSTILVKFISIFLACFIGTASIFSIALADTSTPPSDILDLQAVVTGSTSIQFSWTAPGSDFGKFTESIASYDFRMATSIFTTSNWSGQTKPAGLPTPGQPVTKETFTLTSLLPSTSYYFGIRGVDSFGNLSQSFNLLNVTTLASGTTNVSNVSFYPKIEGVSVPSGVNFTITFFQPNSSTQVYQFTGAADSAGKLVLPVSASLQGGNYDISVFSQYYLRKKLLNYNLATGANINPSVLPAGDLNGDSIINSLDWSVMRPNWLLSNNISDINKDGIVNSVDRSFLVKNWLQSGN